MVKAKASALKERAATGKIPPQDIELGEKVIGRLGPCYNDAPHNFHVIAETMTPTRAVFTMCSQCGWTLRTVIA